MPHASASQIETFDMCPRKWGFRYLDGVYSPSSPAAEFGKEGHKVVEKYLDTGELEGADDIVPLIERAIAKGYLPDPSERLRLEHKFLMPYRGDDHFLGYIDCLVPGEVPIVLDHKFTKDARYAKTEDTLRSNIQAIVYSAVVFWMFPEAKEVINRWVYYIAAGKDRPRKPVGVKKVEIARYKDETRHQMKPILGVVEDLFRLRKTKKKAMDLAPCLTACGAYGGCFHYGVCQKDSTSRTRFSAIMRQSRFSTPKQESKMNLLEKLKKRQQERGATEVNPEPEEKKEEKVEAEAAPAESAKDRLAKLREKKAAAPEPEEKAKPEPEEAKPEEKAAAPEPEETKETKETKARKKRKSSKKLILLLDATVAKSNGWSGATQLSELLKPVMDAVAEETGKAHWSLIGYGEGKGYLATGLDAWLEENEWKGVLQVETSSPEAQAVMEVLIANADVVVRGHA